MFCPLSCEKKWHKLRKVCRIWQEVTVRWINHNVGATLYKTAELLNVNINTGSRSTNTESFFKLSTSTIYYLHVHGQIVHLQYNYPLHLPSLELSYIH